MSQSKQILNRGIQSDDVHRLAGFEFGQPLMVAVQNVIVRRHQNAPPTARAARHGPDLAGLKLSLRWLEAFWRNGFLLRSNTPRSQKIHQGAAMLRVNLWHLLARDVESPAVWRKRRPLPIDRVAFDVLEPDPQRFTRGATRRPGVQHFLGCFLGLAIGRSGLFGRACLRCARSR